MLTRTVTVFRILGFRVRLDASWVLIAVLVTWALAVGWFPAHHDGLSNVTYWWMAVAGALGLFSSIVFHELSHALVARRQGVVIKGITLFVFGGVAEMEEEPKSARSEFLIAVAGPLASFALAGSCYGAHLLGSAAGWPTTVDAVILYLAQINALLAVFNLIPAFPLDGGRVFRAMLWAWKRDLRHATEVTSRIGAAFGAFLIMVGVFQLLLGNLIGGIWMALIGMFLRNAARGSFQHLVLRQTLEGEPVSRFMVRDPITVPPDTGVDRLVEDYIYKYHHKAFPVSDASRVTGCVGVSEIKSLPRDEWSRWTVADIATSCSPQNTIRPDEDAARVLAKMSRSNASRMLVTDDQNHLLGMVTLRDLMDLLALKLQLESGP